MRVADIDWIEAAGVYANLHIGGKELLYRAALHELAESSIPFVLSASIVRLSSISKASCAWSQSPMANLK